MSQPRPLLKLLLVLAVLQTGAALAQERWAVQVVALRDYREAQAAAADLVTLGFDAYTEFAMLDAQQWVRVRVGCYFSREAAAAMASALEARITAQAQAVEFGLGSSRGLGCTEESIGFLDGYDWRLLSDSQPVLFEVTVAGVPATVAHDGSRWRVVQADEQLLQETQLRAAAEFEARRIGGANFVSIREATGSVVVCPGELLASVADVAIVKRGELVLACRFAHEPGEVAVP